MEIVYYIISFIVDVISDIHKALVGIIKFKGRLFR